MGQQQPADVRKARVGDEGGAADETGSDVPQAERGGSIETAGREQHAQGCGDREQRDDRRGGVGDRQHVGE